MLIGENRFVDSTHRGHTAPYPGAVWTLYTGPTAWVSLNIQY